MFNKARLKLTAWYLLIITIISVSFSIFIYKAFADEVDRFARSQQMRLERRIKQGDIFFYTQNHIANFPPPPDFSIVDPELLRETKTRLAIMLFIIDGGIILISGGLGYLLAGKTLKPIQTMIEEQNQFISDSSHELRTPLTALKCSIEVALRDKNLSLQEARMLLTENIIDVDKLKLLSDDLLLVSKYQKQNSLQSITSNSLVDLLKSSINQISPIAKAKNITIDNQVKNINILGNKDSLIRLFVIILDNAIKYSPENAKITITMKNIDEYLAINFIDQGVGIAKKDLPHIFDRFYRADSARSKTEIGGYGLGLAIAKRITEIHHGRISVTSQLSKGSTFTIKLPA